MIKAKLQQAREFIKSSPLKKAGENKFSKYEYFTPEQVNQLVHEAEKHAGIFHKFDLIRDQFGYHGHLEISDVETGEAITFIQATDIPSITATNISQQIGGAVTYTLRYMLMTAFDIADNSMDFDAKDNREPEKKVTPTVQPIQRKPMPDDSFAKMCDALRKAASKMAADKIYMGQTKYYTFDDKQTDIVNQIIDSK